MATARKSTTRTASDPKAPAKRTATKTPSPEEVSDNGDEDIFYLNVCIPTALRERMEAYCDQYGVGRRYLVTRAIEDFLVTRESNPPQ